MPAYGANQVRIIAGEFRGRRLTFPADAGIRPTGDRIRETLFNWLQPVLPASRCLDLFAGSGALGVEAASRGAAEVVLVDQDARVVEQLRRSVQELACDRIRVVADDAFDFLITSGERFDVVFLDPPFDQADPVRLADALVRGAWLAAGARVYLETSRQVSFDPPAGWQLERERQAGEVSYRLLRYR